MKKNYVRFVQTTEKTRCWLIIVNVKTDINATKKWLTQKGCVDIKIRDQYHPEAAIILDFWNPKHEFYKMMARLRPHPDYPINPDHVPHPNQESPVLQDKFLWRQVIRPIVGETGTPVTLNYSHLPALREALARIDDFTTSDESNGIFHYFGISSDDLIPSLKLAINKLDRLGKLVVID